MSPNATRLDPAAVHRTLREAGLRARRSLSQNFLVDVDVLEAILDAAEPGPGRRIVEIGPGLGILTGALLTAGAAVTAVELDAGLAGLLRSGHASAIARGVDAPEAAGSLRLIEGDALDFELTRLVRPPYDVVANLPYHVTSPILHRFLGDVPRPERLVLMLQREVAERIAAPAGALSYLAVFCQYHADVRIVRRVPAEAFEPVPAVESAIVVLEPFDGTGRRRLEPAREADLWRLVQAAFRERRKMLHNVLRRQLPLPAERIEMAFAAVGIDPARRPQTLTVDEWLDLLEALGPVEPDRRGRRPEQAASPTRRGRGDRSDDRSADDRSADDRSADDRSADDRSGPMTGSER